MRSFVRIQQFNKIGEDLRGITADFSLPRDQSQFVFITRKKGTTSGNTYHEGKSQYTNPKVFLLLSGSIKLSHRRIGTDSVFHEEVDAPAKIEIQPLVTHKVEALTDFIILECNSIADIQNDRFVEQV